MSANTPDPPSQPTGLQAMLARLRGMVPSAKPAAPPPAPPPAAIPLALPVGEESPPLALPVQTQPATDPDIPMAEAILPEALPPEAVPPATAPGREVCPYCQAARPGGREYCDNCGWIFQDEAGAPAEALPAAQLPGLLGGRYEIGEQLSQRGEVWRYRGTDRQAGKVVTLLRMTKAPPAPTAPAASGAPSTEDEIVPTFLDPTLVSQASTAVLNLAATWPSLLWERNVLDRARHPVLPAVVDYVTEEAADWLVVEVPEGRSLWDAWEDLDVPARERFGWLRQVAEALHQLHEAGAILEGLRPDVVVIAPDGQARITDLSDLLPLPLPAEPAVKATPYTAPELVLSREADARADLYSFGAMLYALHLGRELTELDFELQGVPKAFLERFPDAHPAVARLIGKTFCREPANRFPTEDAARDDPTGFQELLRTLDACGRALDCTRLDVGAWTTTGMVRSGNEDAFAVLHATASHQDELDDAVLVLLADGMGGYEAGEVAAALAIQALRGFLVRHKPFAAPAGEGNRVEDTPPLAADAWRSLLMDAIKDANRQVFTASRSGVGRPGMGCTAEVVYVSGRRVVVGHVGDSRTYHLAQDKLVQLTRDQTLVNRLVELGTLTPEEAEKHPRRSELQQALGGHPDVHPAIYDAVLRPGDWLVVCSDGLSNQVPSGLIEETLRAATSADAAARRLVNLANLHGATDNATVVVVHVV